MGVTSVVAGNCGGSALDVGEALTNIRQAGVAINFATLIGHNTVRRGGHGHGRTVMRRSPSSSRMKSLVWRGMADGAVGFSTGFSTCPAPTRTAPRSSSLPAWPANAGGLYASHMRNEGTELEKAVEETIRIGELAMCRVQISHLKVDSPSRWGASAKALALIDAARARGVDVEADQYAYTAASSTLGIRFPSWALEGGQRAIAEPAERPGDLGEDQGRRCAGCSPSAGLHDLSFAVVASYRADPVAERPVDEAGRARSCRDPTRSTRSSRRRGR